MSSSQRINIISNIQRPVIALLDTPNVPIKQEPQESIQLDSLDKDYASSSAIAKQTQSVIEQLSSSKDRESLNRVITRSYSIQDSLGVNNGGNTDEMEYPDGGLQAYSVVFGAFCATIVIFGFMNSIGAVQAYLLQHELKEYSVSSIGWMFSVYIFFCLGGGIVAGPIFDFKGATIPMYLGTFLIIAGFFASAECKTVYQFVLAFGVVFGFGTSCLFTVVFGAVSQWFDKNKATALGFVSIGGAIGGIIWPVMLRSALPKVGFKWCMRIIGFISLVLLGTSCLLVKHRITKANSSRNVRDILRNSFVLKDLYRDKIYASYAISLFLCEFAFTFTTSYISSYVIDAGYSESDSFLVLITLNCVSIFGRYIPNYLGDKFGTFNIMCITSTLTGLSMFILWLPFGHNLKVMYAFASLEGLFALSIGSLAPVCCAQISRVEDFGKRYGTVYFLVALANLVSLPIGGAIIGNGGVGYNHMIIVASSLQTLGALFWFITRWTAVGFSVKEKF